MHSPVIELTYYNYNRTFPDMSVDTGKKFLQNVDDISSVTTYQNSTKIRLKYTDVVIEVVEPLEVIKQKLTGHILQSEDEMRASHKAVSNG